MGGGVGLMMTSLFYMISGKISNNLFQKSRFYHKKISFIIKKKNKYIGLLHLAVRRKCLYNLLST